MQGVAAKVWIVFFLFQTPWGVQALLVSCADVTGNGFAFCPGLSALEGDYISWHTISPSNLWMVPLPRLRPLLRP
jgi:hypothetical protein